MPGVPWRVEFSKIFKFVFFQNSKNAQYRSQNVSKRVLNLFWVKFFRNFFCPVFRGGSSFRKFSKKIFSKFQKGPKVFSKVSKRVLNMFWGKLFEKIYAQCSMEGRVFENFPKNQKILKIQKCPKVFPKLSKRVLG